MAERLFESDAGYLILQKWDDQPLFARGGIQAHLAQLGFTERRVPVSSPQRPGWANAVWSDATKMWHWERISWDKEVRNKDDLPRGRVVSDAYWHGLRSLSLSWHQDSTDGSTVCIGLTNGSLPEHVEKDRMKECAAMLPTLPEAIRAWSPQAWDIAVDHLRMRGWLVSSDSTAFGAVSISELRLAFGRPPLWAAHLA